MTTLALPASRLSLASFTRRFALPLWRWYLFGSLMLAAVNYLNLKIPQLAKNVVNAIAGQGGSSSLSSQKDTALVIAGLGILVIIIRSLSRIAIFWPGRRLECDTKSYFFARVLSLSERFFATRGMGDLISRLANDVGQLRAYYAFGMLQALNVVFLTVMTIAQMVVVHKTLTLLALLPLLLMVVLTRWAMPVMQRWSKANQEAMGELTNRVTEAFVNIHVIQANAAESSFQQRCAGPNNDVYLTNMRLVVVRTFVFPLMHCLAGLSQLAVLAYGGHEAALGRLTVGDILSFNVYIGLLTFPLTAMGIIIALHQRAKTAIARLSEIETEAPEQALLPTLSLEPATIAKAFSPAPGLLQVTNLSFAYPRVDKATPPDASLAAIQPSLALQDISFSLPRGGRLGLFGPIGSGKSTLMHVLTRLYDPPLGTVLFDNRDVLSYEPSVLRQKMAYALQSAHLFSDTIRANLLLGLDERTSDQRLCEALAKAQILDEILAFPKQLDTEIGERGVRLSGGQKQRLALARIFLRDAPIWLLDDVLSAVDHGTERRLVEELEKPGRTLIIASHRGSALKRCDEILVLDQGRIVDRGDFPSLLPRWPALGLDV